MAKAILDPLISHGADGLWLTWYVKLGEDALLTTHLTLDREQAERLIQKLHEGVAAEMRGDYGKPAKRGFG